MTKTSEEAFRERPAAKRALRKVRVGVVVSDAMQKTIVVRVSRHVRHPLYGRVIRKSNTIKVHDERNEAKVGDRVKVVETRPLSKDKRWRLAEVVRRASTAPPVPETEQEKIETKATPTTTVTTSAPEGQVEG